MSSKPKEERKGPVDEDWIEPAQERKRNGGRATGAKNYTAREVTVLLDCVAAVKPLGREDWARVAQRHNKTFGWGEDEGRDADSLKKKFRNLVNQKKSTGDGEMPESMDRAMALDIEIRDRAEAIDEGLEEEGEGDDSQDGAEDDEVQLLEEEEPAASPQPQRSSSSSSSKTAKKAVLVSAGPLVFTPKTGKSSSQSQSQGQPGKRKSSGGAADSAQRPGKKQKASNSKGKSGFFTIDPRRPRATNATQQRRRLDSVLGSLAESLQAAAAPAVDDAAIELIAEAQLSQAEQIRGMQADLRELTNAVRGLTRHLAPSPAPPPPAPAAAVAAGAAQPPQLPPLPAQPPAQP